MEKNKCGTWQRLRVEIAAVVDLCCDDHAFNTNRLSTQGRAGQGRAVDRTMKDSETVKERQRKTHERAVKRLRKRQWTGHERAVVDLCRDDQVVNIQEEEQRDGPCENPTQRHCLGHNCSNNEKAVSWPPIYKAKAVSHRTRPSETRRI